MVYGESAHRSFVALRPHLSMGLPLSRSAEDLTSKIVRFGETNTIRYSHD